MTKKLYYLLFSFLVSNAALGAAALPEASFPSFSQLMSEIYQRATASNETETEEVKAVLAMMADGHEFGAAVAAVREAARDRVLRATERAAGEAEWRATRAGAWGEEVMAVALEAAASEAEIVAAGAPVRVARGPQTLTAAMRRAVGNEAVRDAAERAAERAAEAAREAGALVLGSPLEPTTLASVADQLQLSEHDMGRIEEACARGGLTHPLEREAFFRQILRIAPILQRCNPHYTMRVIQELITNLRTFTAPEDQEDVLRDTLIEFLLRIFKGSDPDEVFKNLDRPLRRNSMSLEEFCVSLIPLSACSRWRRASNFESNHRSILEIAKELPELNAEDLLFLIDALDLGLMQNVRFFIGWRQPQARIRNFMLLCGLVRANAVKFFTPLRTTNFLTIKTLASLTSAQGAYFSRVLCPPLLRALRGTTVEHEALEEAIRNLLFNEDSPASQPPEGMRPSWGMPVRTRAPWDFSEVDSSPGDPAAPESGGHPEGIGPLWNMPGTTPQSWRISRPPRTPAPWHLRDSHGADSSPDDPTATAAVRCIVVPEDDHDPSTSEDESDPVPRRTLCELWLKAAIGKYEAEIRKGLMPLKYREKLLDFLLRAPVEITGLDDPQDHNPPHPDILWADFLLAFIEAHFLGREPDLLEFLSHFLREASGETHLMRDQHGTHCLVLQAVMSEPVAAHALEAVPAAASSSSSLLETTVRSSAAARSADEASEAVRSSSLGDMTWLTEAALHLHPIVAGTAEDDRHKKLNYLLTLFKLSPDERLERLEDVRLTRALFPHDDPRSLPVDWEDLVEILETIKYESMDAATSSGSAQGILEMLSEGAPLREIIEQAREFRRFLAENGLEASRKPYLLLGFSRKLQGPFKECVEE